MKNVEVERTMKKGKEKENDETLNKNLLSTQSVVKVLFSFNALIRNLIPLSDIWEPKNE